MRLLPLPLWLLVTAQIEARTQAQAQPPLLPTAIRKMPPDRGAKFHHSYCAFPEANTFAAAAQKPIAAIAARRGLEADDALRLAANSSAELPFRPPFAMLSGPERQEDATSWDLFRRAASALAFLERRQWSCPTGTSSCASIGYPNSCCREGETCFEVPDTGLGPVGCCPTGAACGGGVSGCGDGSMACGSEVGGGCCIPGFVCGGVGCVLPPPPSTSSPPPATPTTLTTTSTTTIPGATPSTVLVTVIITITPSSPDPITSTVTQTSTAPSTTGAGAPFRPTSSPSPSPNTSQSQSASESSSPSTPTTTTISTFCPTGFYPCLARMGGGCCQVGRDCQTTSCPAPAEMTTVVDGNGVTVVVPASGVPSTTEEAGRCADGWFLCGADAGPVAGCCPTGYSCGTASCSVADAAGTATVAKAFPSASSSSYSFGANGGGRLAWAMVAVAVGGWLAF